MSRSGYTEDCDDNWSWIRWRGTVKASIRGRRGQAFLKEMLAALDGLAEPKLIKESLQTIDGAVCAIGSVGKARGIDMGGVDPEDYGQIASTLGIPAPLAQEIMWVNDDNFNRETPEERFACMRKWITRNIKKPTPLWLWS